MAKDDSELTPEYMSLADEFLADALMKEAADYVQRGRRHQSLQLSELNDRWVAAFRDVFARRLGQRVTDMDDLGAELRLRGLEPPYDRVVVEVQKIQDELERLGPNSASESHRRAIGEFLTERRKAKH
jgi:hypothetical protein